MTLGLAERRGRLGNVAVARCEVELPERSIYRLLHAERDRLFPDELFADLYIHHGRRSIPPSILAAATRRVGPWPARPWPWRRCSSQPGAASRRSWIGASTAASTTRPRPSRCSRPACVIRSTWIRFPPSCWRSLTRPWSRLGSRCGFDLPRPAPRANPAVRYYGQLPGPTELISAPQPVLARLLKCQNTSATARWYFVAG